MNYKRCFTFGCSFTNFAWHTWPDIIEQELGIPTENWGLPGLGNVGIFHRMVEADLKNNFNENDLILVVWSTWTREDRYLGDWTLKGNIFNNTDLYDKDFRKKFWHFDNDVIKNATAIISASKMFNINYQASLKHSITTLPEDTQIYRFYQSHLPVMSEFPWDFLNEHDISFEGALRYIDNHPDINAHLTFVKDYVYPSLGLEIKQDTLDYYTKLNKKVVKFGKNGTTQRFIKDNKSLNDFFEKYLEYSQKRFGV